MAGQCGVHGGGVGVVHTVMHGAHERGVMHLLGELGQQLAHLQSGHTATDGRKFAANFPGRVGFHVPHVQVRRAAIEENDDARISPCPFAGALTGEQTRQRKSSRPKAAYAQELAPRVHEGSVSIRICFERITLVKKLNPVAGIMIHSKSPYNMFMSDER